MANEDINIIAFPAPTPPRSPEHVEITSTSFDTEMTCPLTLPDDGSIRSASPTALPQFPKMSGFSANRGGPPQGGRFGGRSNTVSGASMRPEFDSFSGFNGNTFSTNNGYDPCSPNMGGNMAGSFAQMSRSRGNSLQTMGENGVIPLSVVMPGPVYPSDNQLNVAYAYAYRRPDGSYVRLIPTDEISGFVNNGGLRPLQGSEGLIILPMPRAPEPSRRTGTEMVPRDVVRSLPHNQSARPLRSYLPQDPMQAQIDNIVANHPASPPRQKIYCDKWIHEGVCAFTQMGCKYKHEMPMDKTTQMSLGLNHGLPNWYRRAFGVNLNSDPASPPQLPSAGNGNVNVSRLEGPWRRLENDSSKPSQSSNNSDGGVSLSNGNGHGNSNGMTKTRSGPPSHRDFGPVGSPPPRAAFNLFSSLKIEERDDEDDDDAITFTGRRH